MDEAMMNESPMRSCPHCPPGKRESNVVRYGKYGQDKDRQLFLCRSCGMRFRDAGAMGGYSYPPETIGTAIRLFYEGRSFRAIASFITKRFSIEDPGISTQTIRRWVTGFSPALTRAWLERRPDPGLWGTVRHWSVHCWRGSSPLHWCVVMDDDNHYVLAYAVRWGQWGPGIERSDRHGKRAFGPFRQHTRSILHTAVRESGLSPSQRRGPGRDRSHIRC